MNDRLWQLIAERKLPQRITSWTTDITIAETIKGGVPPPGLQGVIFRVTPPEDSVVLNLVELYRDSEFNDAVSRLQGEITGYVDGIGHYRSKQAEVILDLPDLAQCEIFKFGGFTGTVEQITRQELGRQSTNAEIAELVNKLAMSGIEPGSGWWLSHEGSQRVMARVQPHIDTLRARKRHETGS